MASEICARADILSLNICTLLREHMRVHVRGTHARNAGSCRECGRQRTLETGINVPLWQRYIKQQAPRATTRLDRLLQKRRVPTRVRHATKLSSYFPCRSSTNSSTSFESTLLARPGTFFTTVNLREYSIYLN